MILVSFVFHFYFIPRGRIGHLICRLQASYDPVQDRTALVVVVWSLVL